MKKYTKIEEISSSPKLVEQFLIGKKSNIERLKERVPDVVKMNISEVFWSPSSNALAVVASQDWVDYLMGKSDIIPKGDDENDEART